MILTFWTEESVPAFVTNAFETCITISMLTSWQCYALITPVAVVTELTPAFKRSFTVTLQRITSLPTLGHVTQVTGPAMQALHFTIIIAHVMTMLVLRRWHFASLKQGNQQLNLDTLSREMILTRSRILIDRTCMKKETISLFNCNVIILYLVSGCMYVHVSMNTYFYLLIHSY